MISHRVYCVPHCKCCLQKRKYGYMVTYQWCLSLSTLICSYRCGDRCVSSGFLHTSQYLGLLLCAQPCLLQPSQQPSWVHIIDPTLEMSELRLQSSVTSR